MLYICVQKGDGNLKKKIQTALRPGRAAFYVLFLLFAACGLYFSKPYGFIGMAIVINLGSNFFFGEISYITKALSAVLQLAVTMDYSIFLWHSYNERLSMGEQQIGRAHV